MNYKFVMNFTIDGNEATSTPIISFSGQFRMTLVPHYTLGRGVRRQEVVIRRVVRWEYVCLRGV